MSNTGKGALIGAGGGAGLGAIVGAIAGNTAIGAVIGGFILVLVKPMHAFMFVIFTLILQTCDGYIIKPKLFGDSLGVSGLLILVSIIVCGNMFGIIGILLAIPLAAIADFVYGEELIPLLERRKAERKAAESIKQEEKN